ncbi:MAG: S1 RNA-binding domain-containing protein [Fimbriimonadia bacterium]|nr:S1 RNA-binding domain-containing protein [Fimbriimonadia bacterium]
MWMDEDQKPVDTGEANVDAEAEMTADAPAEAESETTADAPVEAQPEPNAPVAEAETPAVEADAPEETPAEEPAAQPAPAAEIPPEAVPMVAEAAEAEAAPTAALTTAPEPEREMTMEKAFSMDDAIEQSFRSLEKGEIIEATVVQVDREGVLVDVGTKAEGLIPLNELSQDRLTSAEGVVEVGEKINVKVIEPYSKEGFPVLSKKGADFEDLWVQIEDSLNNKQTMHAMVIERVKGGLVVDLGVRGFVPASHVGMQSHPRDLDRLVGQSLPIKLLDVDREKRKVIASNRLAEEELREVRDREREQRKQQVFNQLNVDDVLEGVVKRLVEYGAFVDIGGYEGLLHVSEMSWTRVEDPKDVLKVNERIRVKVLRLDREKGKVSLGLRQVLPDPWSEVKGRYHMGQTVEATVTRTVRSGAFARLPEGIEAFIPIGEISMRRIKKVEDVVNTGDPVTGLIIELVPDQRRMVLSLRALSDEPMMRESAPERSSGGGRRRGGQQRGGMSASSGSGGFSIGDRLQGQLKGYLQPEHFEDDDLSDLEEEMMEESVETEITDSAETAAETSEVEAAAEETAAETSEMEAAAEETAAETSEMEAATEETVEAGNQEPDGESEN